MAFIGEVMENVYKIDREGIRGLAVLKEDRGVKEAMYVAFLTNDNTFRDRDLAIELIKDGAEVMKGVGGLYIYAKTTNPAVAMCFLSIPEGLVAYYGDDLVEDAELLKEDIIAKAPEDMDLCRLGNISCDERLSPEEKMEKELWVGWPLNGDVIPPIHYMQLDENNVVTHVTKDKPSVGGYIKTQEFLPGDERYFEITLKEDGLITSVAKNIYK